MDQKKLKKINYELVDTFLSAGKLSLELRRMGLKKEIKDDQTPVTNGDLEVDKILTEKITNLTPEIPIVSEESSKNKLNTKLKNFWLIDPIDGTYDYINNGDEFTLNAGLIINNKAIMGIIYAPAKDKLFYSYGKDFNFKFTNKKEKKIQCEKKTPNDQVIAVAYSKNLKPEILQIHNKFGVTSHVRMKSSLKFCVVATGEFDLYVAEPRASEWDIAAGHAILENAGGIITDHEGNEIIYGKKDFKNPSLILKRSNNL